MRLGRGFTIIELMIAVAIVGLLAALGYPSFESLLEKSNFRTMREFGVDLALNQQLHRQRYGRYAQNITSAGISNPTLLVMPTSDQYQVVISRANFRGYIAEVKPSPEAPLRLPEECQTVIVRSDIGLQRFEAKSASNTDTSAVCIPHG